METSAAQERTSSALEQRGNDYDIEHVPQEFRKSTLPLTIIWTCWTFQFATIMVGGMIGQGLPLWSALGAIVVGNFILAIFAGLLGYMGYKTGLGTAMLTRFSFGHKGSWIPSALMGIIMFGWLIFCYWIFSLTVSLVLGNFGVAENTGFIIGALIATIATIIPLTYGYEGPKWVACLTIPCFLIPVFIVVVLLMSQAGGWSYVAATYVPVETISFVFAINLCLGAWLNGSLLAADWQRLAKSTFGGIAPPGIGLVIGENLVLGLGAITIAATFGAFWNPIEAALAVGGTIIVFVLIVYLVGMYNTMVPTTSSSALNFANILQRPKTYPAVVLALLAPIGAIIIHFSIGALVTLDTFVALLAAIQPPIAGILVAEFYILAKRKLPPVTEVKRLFHVMAFAVWIISSALDQWTRNWYRAAGPEAGIEYGIPGVNGFIIAIVLYTVLSLLLKTGYKASAEELSESS